jgi:hypothetical protein
MNSPRKRLANLRTVEPRVETCWALVGPSRRPLTCGIYRTEFGLEIRVGYDTRRALYSRMVAELSAARVTAERLRDAVNSEGVFEELLD